MGLPILVFETNATRIYIFALPANLQSLW